MRILWLVMMLMLMMLMLMSAEVLVQWKKREEARGCELQKEKNEEVVFDDGFGPSRCLEWRTFDGDAVQEREERKGEAN